MSDEIPRERLWKKPDPDFDFKRKDRRFTPTVSNPLCLLDRHESLSSYPSSSGLVSAAYRDAIEVSLNYISKIGLGMITAIIPIFAIAFGWYLALVPFNSFMRYVAIIQTLLFSNAAVFLVMLDFMPRCYVLFNRKDRTVSFQQVKLPHFLAFWRKVDRPFVTYSWDEAKARIYRENEVIGGQLSRTSHSVWLLWGDSTDGRRYKDSVRIGDTGSFEAAPMRLWEHVRRFMEEDGPHLSPNDGIGGATRTRFTPPFPDAILAAAGPSLTRPQSAAFARWSPK